MASSPFPTSHKLRFISLPHFLFCALRCRTKNSKLHKSDVRRKKQSVRTSCVNSKTFTVCMLPEKSYSFVTYSGFSKFMPREGPRKHIWLLARSPDALWPQNETLPARNNIPVSNVFRQNVSAEDDGTKFAVTLLRRSEFQRGADLIKNKWIAFLMQSSC